MNRPHFTRHHAIVAGKAMPPSQALLEALKQTSQMDLAIDLGCGAGTDSIYLLEQGWQVLAIDKNQHFLDSLQSRWPDQKLTLQCQAFETLTPPGASLINASFALPFCAPEHFATCWSGICRSLPSGGMFSGHFFGLNDSWAGRSYMTFHTAEQYQSLFRSFEITWQTEIEKDGKALGGEPKHWHVYHVAARKL